MKEGENTTQQEKFAGLLEEIASYFESKARPRKDNQKKLIR